MEVLNPIFILDSVMKCDCVHRMFPVAKWDISEWGSIYESKSN